jgi:Domain of unknown function (DUF5679)
MAKTAKDKPSASAEEALQRQKRQARKEAKLMLAIEEANKDLKKAEQKIAKAQARKEARSAYLFTLEASLAELRAQGPESKVDTPPQSTGFEYQQEQPEMESGMVGSNGNQLASSDQEYQDEITERTDLVSASPQVEEGIGLSSSSSNTGTPTSIGEEQSSPFVEEAPSPEVMVVTKAMTEAYCVKCKKKTEMKDAHEVTMKNGKHAMKGQCAVCGTTTQVFLAEKKA